MKKITLTSIILLTCFVQCQKDKQLPFCEQFPEDCVDIMTVKDHFYFDVGTYWVYKEETSGQIDSQWVSQAFTLPNVCWFDYRIQSSIMSHYFNISTLLLTSAIDSGLVKKEVSVYINRSKTKPGSFIGNSHIAAFYYKAGTSFYNVYGNLILEDRKDTFIVNDIEFNDVLKVFDESNLSENRQQTYHYYAKSIGLVKKELIDSNQVWNLIRYHIVK